MTARSDKGPRKLAVNRRALHDYHVIDRLEAGIELRGTEVKSIRAATVTLAGGYARVVADQVYLCGVTVPLYQHGSRFNHDPERERRILLHRREIRRLQAETEQKGCVVVPLSLYLKNGRVKVELGLCRGKRQRDKRETLKRKTAQREAERAMRRGTRRSGRRG